MTTRNFVQGRWRFVLIAAFNTFFVIAAAPGAYAQGPGGPNGVDILIRAENRSTTDTPFCGVGGGLVGDKLAVDAFMNMGGVVTGAARFEDANGNVTLIELDRLFTFLGNFLPEGVGGGVLVQNQANQNTVPIWLNDNYSIPALVNVELPRGCGNTKSTFTPGLDKVTVQIKFR